MKISKYWIGLLLLLVSCGPDQLSPDRYLHFFADPENTAIRKKIKTSKITYEFSIYSPQYIALRETLKGSTPDMMAYRQRIGEIKDFIYVHIKCIDNISGKSVVQTGATSEEEIAARSSYYQFTAGKDIYAVCGKDTLKPLEYQFEDSYNMTNFSLINLVFKPSSGSKLTICFDDRAANNHHLSATLSSQSFPELKY